MTFRSTAAKFPVGLWCARPEPPVVLPSPVQQWRGGRSPGGRVDTNSGTRDKVVFVR